VHSPVFHVEKRVGNEPEVTVVSHIVGTESRPGQGGAFEAVQRSSHVGRPKLEGATIPTGEGVVNAKYQTERIVAVR